MKVIWQSGDLQVQARGWGLNTSCSVRECFFGDKKLGAVYSDDVWAKKYKSDPQLFARKCVDRRIAVLNRAIDRALKERNELELV